MNALMRVVVIMPVVFLLSACATPNVLLVSGGQTEYVIPIDPPVQVGIQATVDVLAGNLTVYEGLFPATMSGEIRDNRMRWPAFAVGIDKEGNITRAYRAQAIFIGYRGCKNPQRVFHVFIEGAKSHPSYDMKIVIASTLMTKLYGLDGTGPVLADTESMEFLGTDMIFLDNEKYRNEKIRSVGTSSNQLMASGHQIDETEYSRAIFPKMHIFDVFKDSKEVLPVVTPLNNDQMLIIAEKNPGYTFAERAGRDATWAHISANPYAIASGILFGLMADGLSDKSGWDEKSSLTGEELQTAFDYDTALRKASTTYDCNERPE
jgi:hypothetical protein